MRPPTLHTPVVIGHRGCIHAVENSLEAVELAGELGADYAEIDVQLSADGVPVVIYDDSLWRLAGEMTGVGDLTWAELQALTIRADTTRGLGQTASIPSLEEPGLSVLDEFYRLNKHDPNYSLCRATVDRGRDAHTDGKFDLSQKGCMEIVKLFLTPDEDLYDKTIEDVFDEEVFDSTFWLYWRTMFAFKNWHSALEMKL